MTNKHLVLAAICAVVVIGLGWFAFNAFSNEAALGVTTVGYQTSQGSIQLYNALNAIIQDLQNVRSASTGNVTTTSAFGFGAIGPIGSTTSTASTTFTLTGANPGDFINVIANTVTPTATIDFYGRVVSANTVQVVAQNMGQGGVAATPPTSTYYILDVPQANITAAASAQLATSTTSF